VSNAGFLSEKGSDSFQSVISAVIFDCDGVLFDSWRANVAFYNAILDRLGLPPMDAKWERHAHTMASSQVFDAMFADDAELLERAQSTAREIDYGPFYELMEPADGLHEILAGLRRTYRLAMASNRSSTAIGVVRRFDLEQYLHHTVGVGNGIRPKPHPDMLLVCLERLQVTAPETVFVGDSPSDRDAARAAGVHFIAIGDQELDAPRVSALRDLPDLLTARWAARSLVP
jgi:HAD superfamily hydrolase (TIGR01509 family)